MANIRFLEGERGNSVAAHAADAQLKEETALWNTWLAQGKWKYFMAMEPADDMWDQYRISNWTMPKPQEFTSASISSVEIPKKNRQYSFALEAENFKRKIDKPKAAWEIIPGLGRSGRGSLAVFPVTAARLELESVKHAPRVEYDVVLPETGEITLHVYLIPTHPLAGSDLRFALALNEQTPQMVAYDVKDGSAEWAQGVLDSTRIATTTVTVKKPGKQVLKFYGVDAGVLLDKIVVDIDGVAPSYLGLPTASSAL